MSVISCVVYILAAIYRGSSVFIIGYGLAIKGYELIADMGIIRRTDKLAVGICPLCAVTNIACFIVNVQVTYTTIKLYKLPYTPLKA